MNYDIICFSHLRWRFVYQRPQHLMSRLAEHRRIFFVEEPIIHPIGSGANYEIYYDPAADVNVITPYLPAGLDEDGTIDRQREILEQVFYDHSI